jgi:phenylalanyl-tRNA synthetase beta subunit
VTRERARLLCGVFDTEVISDDLVCGGGNGEYLTVTVIDPSAQRRDIHGSQDLVLRPLRSAGMVEQLQVYELQHNRNNHDDND